MPKTSQIFYTCLLPCLVPCSTYQLYHRFSQKEDNLDYSFENGFKQELQIKFWTSTLSSVTTFLNYIPFLLNLHLALNPPFSSIHRLVQPPLSSFSISSFSTPLFPTESIFSSQAPIQSGSTLMEVGLISVCCERHGEEGKVNWFQRLSLRRTAGEEEEERERGRCDRGRARAGG